MTIAVTGTGKQLIQTEKGGVKLVLAVNAHVYRHAVLQAKTLLLASPGTHQKLGVLTQGTYFV